MQGVNDSTNVKLGTRASPIIQISKLIMEMEMVMVIGMGDGDGDEIGMESILVGLTLCLLLLNSNGIRCGSYSVNYVVPIRDRTEMVAEMEMEMEMVTWLLLVMVTTRMQDSYIRRSHHHHFL